MQNDTRSNLVEVPASPDGYRVGQASTEYVSFFGATPIVQPSGAGQAAVGTAASTATSPYGFATSTQADAIVTLVNQLRSDLVSLGLIKGSA
jgi:hypothetical protein